MGSYHYYDTCFIEDAQPELHSIHDCMWSGECFACQPARMAFSNSAAAAAAAAAAVVAETNSTTRIDLDRSTSTVAATALPMPTELDRHCNYLSVPPATFTRCELERLPVHNERASPERSVHGQRTIGIPRRSASICKSTSFTSSSSTNQTSSHSSSCNSDNKKLRHREVEKNRHRQLQAMVKTLSDKIPGRLEKETQVQTMKRAARYCIYLRDVMNVLHHGLKATKSSSLKQKLEEIYLRSCDNVELVMSQHTSAR